MAVKYLENLATTHYVAKSYDAIQAEYVKWLDIADKEGAYQKNDTKNRVKLSEIQLNFAKANNLFYKKKYSEALKTYKYVQGLVFQLLYPSFRPVLSVDSMIDMPVKADLFEPLLKAGSEMAVSLPPEGIQSAVSYVSVKSLPDDVQKYAKSFDEAGVTTSDDIISNDVRNLTLLGLEYAKSNEWEQAEALFKQGLEMMGSSDSDESKYINAALSLDLGAVYVQKGDLRRATASLKKAEQMFKEIEDNVGLAQAKLNSAAILSKQGKTDEAAALSKEAVDLLGSEGGAVPSPSVTPLGDITDIPAVTDPAINPTTAASPRISPRVVSSFTLNPPLTAVNLGTSIKPSTIVDLAEKKGGGVIFRLPAAGDGWITQELEGSIEKKQKIQQKDLGVTVGDNILKFKWTQSEGLNTTDVKQKYYEKRTVLQGVEAIKNNYILATDIAINLPHMYLYQLPVCIGDCYHYLGEFKKAEEQYLKASAYEYINTAVEVPALWLKLGQNYLEWGNSHYKNDDVQKAANVYMNVIQPDGTVPVNSPLYKNKLNEYGAQVSNLINNIADADASELNPVTINLVLDISNKLKMINAGLDYFGVPANYFPIFKFDFLQSTAIYFAQQAIQAEREYINFISRGEDEQLTREQLQQSVELSSAQVDLAKKQVEYSQAELEVNQENAQLADLRLKNAKDHKDQFADISYEITALDAATVFASGPEGYKVSYTYYSPSEGKNVTLSGSDAYKVMEDAAWKKGMLSREMELSNMERNIAELNENKQLAEAQLEAAQINVDVAKQQQKIAEMNKKHSQELLNSFESQIFTPEVWFQLGSRMLYISKNYLQHAIGIARKMQKAYELETGRALNSIKNEYNTNIISGLLSADYLLADINYFTVDRINNSAKDIPVKQMFSLAQLNPTGFETTFKATGELQFELSLEEFDRLYPGSYLRKIKKIEVIVEGLIPPEGVHGTLKNSGISRDRKKNGDIFFRIQPCETMYLSNYSPRNDVIIFQPDSRVLDLFENCGVATGWTLTIPPAANDIDFRTISDVKLIVYYTANFDPVLANNIIAQLPAEGEKSTAIPFRILFPDEYYNFIDKGELKFSLYENDFAFNETNLKVKNISLKIIMEEGADVEDLNITLSREDDSVDAVTDEDGIVRSDETDDDNPLNDFIGKDLCTEWTIQLTDAANAGLDRSKMKDMFFFIEYSFKYKGM